jgi:hypothetical protein
MTTPPRRMRPRALTIGNGLISGRRDTRGGGAAGTAVDGLGAGTAWGGGGGDEAH